jgi:hypothetical protein
MGTIRKSLRRSVATILRAAFSATIARAGAADDRIAALQAKFRCPIFKYLEAIHNYPTPERTDNRFLIIMIAHRVDERYYAQCAYDSGDARMICEIDSPFFNPSMKKYFRGDKLKLVKALGYRLHRKMQLLSISRCQDAGGTLRDRRAAHRNDRTCLRHASRRGTLVQSAFAFSGISAYRAVAGNLRTADQLTLGDHPHHRAAHAGGERAGQDRAQAEADDVTLALRCHRRHAADHDAGAAEIGETAHRIG